MFFRFDPLEIALRIPVLLIAITVHEYAHARMAYHFGDATAQQQGRMNLNPINHLDPIGTLMILLVGFGWAKPVPINPYQFRNYRVGLRWVSLAGPLANFALGFISLIFYSLLFKAGISAALVYGFMSTLVQINILLGIFNLIPIPPLDGSKILVSVAPDAFLRFYRQLEPYAPLLLLMLIVTGLFGRIIFPAYELVLSVFYAVIRFIPGLA
ncbi:MAG: site-2 protease family protein [Bacillota bacterium]